jgi:hypothetical protein
MLTEHVDAATAAFHVGYESPSQFSREYGVVYLARPRYATSQNCVRWLIVKGTETEGRGPKYPLFLKKTCHPTEIAIFFF